ncbi:MAG: hypothetical protein AB1449_02320 [Chloroflexota bacterium]
MSRLIRPQPAFREREQLLQAVAGALRAGACRSLPEDESRDVLAFTALALEALQGSVEATAAAWEKREYWLKADRFRAQWAWLGDCHHDLAGCLARRDWSGAAEVAARLVTHLAGVRGTRRPSRAQPWLGAWETWQARELHARSS